jgi:carbon monoxide dehydrogenase subunit G
MIAAIALAAIVALAALLLYAASRPDTMKIERSVRIQADADRIKPLINDIKRFNTWNPYNHKDPTMKGSYRGPTSGPGAAYDFDGNKNVGKGSIQIVEPTGPDRVSMTLDMTAPMACHNLIDFTIAPRGAATDVTWTMTGPCPFLGKLMGVIFNMDKMVGRDFENGLTSLKKIAEQH